MAMSNEDASAIIEEIRHRHDQLPRGVEERSQALREIQQLEEHLLRERPDLGPVVEPLDP